MMEEVFGGIAIAESTHIYLCIERFTKYLSLESLPLEPYFFVFLS